MSLPVNNGPPRSLIIPPNGTMGFCLAIIRIFLGVRIFVPGLAKWSWITGRESKFEPLVHHLINNHLALTWFTPFLKNLVSYNINLFTWMMVVGELVLGVMLMAGFCTRLAAFLAMIMLFCYTCGSWYLGSAYQGMNEALFVMAFVCMITGAGRVFGFDFDMAHRNNRSILW